MLTAPEAQSAKNRFSACDGAATHTISILYAEYGNPLTIGRESNEFRNREVEDYLREEKARTSAAAAADDLFNAEKVRRGALYCKFIRSC